MVDKAGLLKGIYGVVGGIGLFCGIFLIGVFVIIRHDAYKDGQAYWSKWIGVAIVGGILSLCRILGSCFTPGTKEMCAIKVIPMIVNNEQVQGLPNKVIELANE